MVLPDSATPQSHSRQFTLTELKSGLDNIRTKLSNADLTDNTDAFKELSEIISYINSIKPDETYENSGIVMNELSTNMTRTKEAIEEREQEIIDKIQRTKLQEREIEDKKKLIETRNRMLQISQEKNIYKKKIIYTLISIIIAISLIIITGYTFFNRIN